MPVLTKKFKDISLKDLPEVGGKNASLGEMFTQLHSKGIQVPDGFATTAAAFWRFLDENNLRELIRESMATLDRKTFSNLKEVGAKARAAILQTQMPLAPTAERKGCACPENFSSLHSLIYHF